MLDIIATRALITDYEPLNVLEAYNKQTALQFLADGAITRKHFSPGQLTAGAWIIARDTKRVLLIHHIKSGRWFQPGGHIEPEDVTLFDVAVREVLEECGFRLEPTTPPRIFDIDVHGITEKGDEPEHLHCDVRFLYMLDKEPVLTVDPTSAAIKEARWVTLDEARQLMHHDTSNNRFFVKTPLLF